MIITNKIFKNLDLASEDDRIKNFSIDFFISSSLGFSCSYLFFDNLFFDILIYYFVRTLYYFFFEYFFGKTPAKFETGSKVVNKENKKPSISQIIKRTLSRFFSLVSAISDDETAIHDNISNTFVVKDNKKQEVNYTKVCFFVFYFFFFSEITIGFLEKKYEIDFFRIFISFGIIIIFSSKIIYELKKVNKKKTE